MLTYESRGKGTRVALLTLNRGEGGANVMSNGFFDALGLVRTMELLSAGCYYGVDRQRHDSHHGARRLPGRGDGHGNRQTARAMELVTPPATSMTIFVEEDRICLRLKVA